MIGELLEFAIDTDSIGSSVDFYRKLGFSEAPVAELLDGPYSAVCIPGLHIGLRRTNFSDPVPTFVRPDLKNYLRGLKHAKVNLEFATLDDHSFHRAGFQDPNGQLVELLEARTYPPVSLESSSISIAGRFIEYSMPARSIDDSVIFWSKLGVTPVEEGTEPAPWAKVAGRGLRLGLYSGRRFAPGLSFACKNLAARIAFLEAKGCIIDNGAPFGKVDAAATLQAPDRQVIYLFETDV